MGSIFLEFHFFLEFHSFKKKIGYELPQPSVLELELGNSIWLFRPWQLRHRAGFTGCLCASGNGPLAVRHCFAPLLAFLTGGVIRVAAIRHAFVKIVPLGFRGPVHTSGRWITDHPRRIGFGG
jgi:hypothetical protein